MPTHEIRTTQLRRTSLIGFTNHKCQRPVFTTGRSPTSVAVPVVMHTFCPSFAISQSSIETHTPRAKGTTHNFGKGNAVRMLRSRRNVGRSFFVALDKRSFVAMITQSWRTLEAWRLLTVTQNWRYFAWASLPTHGYSLSVVFIEGDSRGRIDLEREGGDSLRRSIPTNYVRISDKRGAIVALSFEFRRTAEKLCHHALSTDGVTIRVLSSGSLLRRFPLDNNYCEKLEVIVVFEQAARKRKLAIAAFLLFRPCSLNSRRPSPSVNLPSRIKTPKEKRKKRIIS